MIAALVLGFVYSARRSDVERFLKERTARQALGDYVDNTVLRALSMLTEDASRLDAAVTRLRADRNDANVSAAAEAWRAAHRSYLTTIAFHYGPASYHDFDKRLAEWPFDRILVEHALGEMESGRLPLDSRLLREEKLSTTRGFYTMEYLLFRQGRPRRAEEFRPAELDYLAAASRALLEESMDFEASWRGMENLPASGADVIRRAGIPARRAFADEFRNPGRPGSRYVSLSIPLQEIFQEIAGVVEDIMPALRELSPTESGLPDYLERPDACDDLLTTLRGAENAWLGGIEGFREHSVSELAARYSKVADRRVKIAFAHAAHRIAALRDLSGKSPEERELAVRVAEAECDRLLARLAAATQPIIADETFLPWKSYGR